MNRLVFDPGGHAVDTINYRILSQFCRQNPDKSKNSSVENGRFLFILAALVTVVTTAKFLDLDELDGGSIHAHHPATDQSVHWVASDHSRAINDEDFRP
jgi:hypothetical protein